MSIKRVFCSTIPSCKYHFKSGKEAAFVGGKYYTDIDTEIAELEAEVGKGREGIGKSLHPIIYIDANMREIDEADLDPVAAIKRKAVEEYLALQAKALDPKSDKGNTNTLDTIKAKIAAGNTSNMSAVAATSNAS